MPELLKFEGIAPELEVRSESKREIAIRFMKWGMLGRTAQGLEKFRRGAFADSDPSQVVLRMEHEGAPTGIGIALEERDDGAVMVFRVANTHRGDEQLQLAKEGLLKGASPSFHTVDGGTLMERAATGERVAVRTKVDLREVSTTWRPTYEGTEVIYARSAAEVKEMAEEPQGGGELVTEDDALQQRLQNVEARAAYEKQLNDYRASVEQRIKEIEERAISLPEPEKPVPPRSKWMQGALKVMDGEALWAEEERALADLITTNNAGLVPPAYSKELIGVIDPTRPFMQTTRRIEMPESGTQIIFPRIVTRPQVGLQENQKEEVTSTQVATDTVAANLVTYAGAGDISLQLLRRSSPSFLDYYIELLAEAYARTTEAAAVTALLASGVSAGGAFSVTNPVTLGASFTNSINAIRRPPDTIWLSTQMIAAMINAKEGGTNRPLYSNAIGFANQGLTAQAGNMPSGELSGLRPVWTPALDTHATIRAVVGPSQGFAWAEEGSFTLQADVPGRLGRDVALAGFVAFLALYPAAFTTYTQAA